MNSASASTGPDSSAPSASASQPPSSPSKSTSSRQTHIRFPTEADLLPSKASLSSTLSGPGLHSEEAGYPGLGLGPAPGSSLGSDLFERRRVRSAHVSSRPRSIASQSRVQYLSTLSQSRTSEKRSISHSLHGTTRSNPRSAVSIGSSPLTGGVLLPSENDTAGQADDPNILADLHKALQYKPHVEQHLKEAKSLKDFVPSPLPSNSGPSSGPSSNSSPIPFSTRAQLPVSEPNTPINAEVIDFSPAAGRLSLHPVPSSMDDGATLDWSGSATDDGKHEKHERKWPISMSLPRRSSRDKDPPLSRKALVEKQDVQYSEKLARIKDKVNELTMRKAEITKSQLQRRYAALDIAVNTSVGCLNLAEVARWYDKQENMVKAAIAESEPMPWLQHLIQRRGHKLQSISPWNLSAMIVEHYVRSNSDFESPFILNSPGGDNVSDAGSSASVAKQRQTSKPTPLGCLDGTLARKSSDLISFEPMVQSRPDSMGTESRVSVDSQLKRWRQSLLNRADPEASSDTSVKNRRRTLSVDQDNAQAAQSSSGARSPFHGLGLKKRSQPSARDSDDGHSSPADSIAGRFKESKESEDKENRRPDRDRKRSRLHLSLDLKYSQDEAKRSPPPLSIEDLRTDANQPSKSQSLPTGEMKAAAESGETFDQVSSPNNYLGSPIALNLKRNTHQRKPQSLSVPPAFQTPRARRRRSDTRTEAQNHALQVEYTRKKELLDALVARNQRMRNLLQIAARSIIDYDETQSAMTEKLRISYSRLPPDVIEVLKHDPSVSTGHLRDLKGWRAVEDIHSRRERQKSVLQSFVVSSLETVTPLSLPSGGIYETSIASLTDLVERLHKQRGTVLSHVKQAHELLSKVKKTRDELKPAFDEASKYTSVNYPELVRLEALLDEFVNETNHLWKIAEASLSFLLASVAPLMKAFGRPVWNELHDFLVIPLYRNGFSGEDHWYPVTFPHRSFVHWLRLLLFAVATPITLHQGSHAFVALLTHGYVIRIPSFIPAFVIYVVFSGIMCAFGSLLFGLLIAVLCELFIVLWWTLWLLHIVR